MRNLLAPELLVAIALGSAVPHAAAQDGRVVDLDGYAAHVVTAGWEHAGSGTPTVVFEGGATLPAEAWAPVVALVAEAPPPYVLAAHSWASWLARAYAGRYPDEVADLVLIDPTPPRSVWEAAYAEVGARAEERSDFDRFMEAMAASWPPPAQTQHAAIAEYADRGADPDVPAAPGVPVAVLVAGTHGDETVPDSVGSFPLAAFLDALKRRQAAAAVEWIRATPGGTLVLAAESGHCIQCDDPALVAWAIRRVLDTNRADR